MTGREIDPGLQLLFYEILLSLCLKAVPSTGSCLPETLCSRGLLRGWVPSSWVIRDSFLSNLASRPWEGHSRMLPPNLKTTGHSRMLPSNLFFLLHSQSGLPRGLTILPVFLSPSLFPFICISPNKTLVHSIVLLSARKECASDLDVRKICFLQASPYHICKRFLSIFFLQKTYMDY